MKKKTKRRGKQNKEGIPDLELEVSKVEVEILDIADEPVLRLVEVAN